MTLVGIFFRPPKSKEPPAPKENVPAKSMLNTPDSQMPDWLRQDLAALGSDLEARVATQQLWKNGSVTVPGGERVEGSGGSRPDPRKVLALMHWTLLRLRRDVRKGLGDLNRDAAPVRLRGKVATYKAGLTDICTGVDMQLSFWKTGDDAVIVHGGARIDAGVDKLTDFVQGVAADVANKSNGHP
jgi:hypothetical protein